MPINEPERKLDLSIIRPHPRHVGVDPFVAANDGFGIGNAAEGVSDGHVDRPKTDDGAAAQAVAVSICGVTDSAA